MEDSNRDQDRQDFKRLANKRVNNALKYIRLVGNLSNTSNYYYTTADVNKIFHALQGSLDECKKLFDNKNKKKENFSLDEPEDTREDLA